MTEGTLTLRYAVRPAIVGKYLGQLGFVLALLTAVPLLTALIFADYAIALRYAAVIALLLFLAWLTRRLPTPGQLQQNEAMVIVAMAFILSPLLMSFPMMASGLSWHDAIFEAISAVTTTGLSTLASVEELPRTFLFARAWMQWYGGLGIVVLSIALLMGHHIASRRLAETTAAEELATTARTYARRVLGVYLLFTLAAILTLYLLGLPPFEAITHALAAVSTGGFSTYDASLGGLPHGSQAVVVVVIGLFGAIPLHLYYRLRMGQAMASLLDMELRLLLVTSVLAAGVLTLLLQHHGMGWSEALFHGTIQGISAQSTSGFSSLPIRSLDDGSKLALIIAMFIGGGVGSTAGGIKLLRLMILLRLLQLLLRRIAMPSHAVLQPRLAQRPLEESDIQWALLLILLFVTVNILSWMLFVLYGYAPLDALFEVVSATATVGLSTGITRPELEPVLRLMLCADMLLGRLEIVALMVLLYPYTWFGKRTES
jgi:trk system potassium uptake protein TrkH